MKGTKMGKGKRIKRKTPHHKKKIGDNFNNVIHQKKIRPKQKTRKHKRNQDKSKHKHQSMHRMLKDNFQEYASIGHGIVKLSEKEKGKKTKRKTQRYKKGIANRLKKVMNRNGKILSLNGSSRRVRQDSLNSNDNQNIVKHNRHNNYHKMDSLHRNQDSNKHNKYAISNSKMNAVAHKRDILNQNMRIKHDEPGIKYRRVAIANNPLASENVHKRQAIFIDKDHPKKKETLITVLREDKSLRDKDILRLKKATVAKGNHLIQ